MELEEIKKRVEAGDMRLSDALARCLPKFHGLTSDDVLIWCSNELQGYQNGLDYYQRRFTNLPKYRVVRGILKVMRGAHRMAEISHPLAERNEYFLSAPIGWLEDFYSLPGELSVVDMPELTSYIGKQSGGNIICQCTKQQLFTIITSFKQPFLETIDQVIKRKEKRKVAAAAMAAENDPWSAVAAAQFMKGDEPVARAPGQVSTWGTNVPAMPRERSAGAVKPPAPPLPNAGAPAPPLPAGGPAAPSAASKILERVVRPAPAAAPKPESRKLQTSEGADLPMHFMRALIPSQPSEPNSAQSQAAPKVPFRLIDPTASPTVTSRIATGYVGSSTPAHQSVPAGAVQAGPTAPLPAAPPAVPQAMPPQFAVPPQAATEATGLPRALPKAPEPAPMPQSPAPQSQAAPAVPAAPISTGLPRSQTRASGATSPTAELPASAATQIKAKAMDLMRSAYGVRDWVLPTWEFSLLDPKEREFNKAALDYILKKGWARAGKDANVFLLTKAGAAQVEDTLEI